MYLPTRTMSKSLSVAGMGGFLGPPPADLDGVWINCWVARLRRACLLNTFFKDLLIIFNCIDIKNYKDNISK